MKLASRSFQTRSTKRVWFIPLVYVIVAVILGLLVPAVDVRREVTSTIFTSAVAISVLSAIASGMIAFTGIVFSMAFLMIQFSSTAYSPRLAGYFLLDDVVRNALGMFTATFIYALISLTYTGVERANSGFTLTVSVGLLAVLGSAILFLALMQRVTTLQVGNVLHSVGDRGRAVITTLYPLLPADSVLPDRVGAPAAVDVPDLPAVTQTIIYDGGPMDVIEINFQRLADLARHAQGLIEVEYPVGDTVPNGAPLLRVRGG